MARPGDATCPRCGERRTVPGWVRGVAPPNWQGDPSDWGHNLWFQFTFPKTFLARHFDRGDRTPIRCEFDLCVACGLLWSTHDPAGIEVRMRKATGEAVFGKPKPVEPPGVADAELDGPT